MQAAPLLNIGTGEDCSIRELAQLVRQAVGFSGKLVFDSAKPDGTPPQAAGCVQGQVFGLAAGTALKDGIGQVCRWYEDELRQ